MLLVGQDGKLFENTDLIRSSSKNHIMSNSKQKNVKCALFFFFFSVCNRDLSNLSGPPFSKKGTRQMDCQESTPFKFQGG